MNALEKYFDDSGDTLHGLAKRTGRSPSTLTRAVRGERQPGDDLALSVERETGQQVTAEEFIMICFKARASKRSMNQFERIFLKFDNDLAFMTKKLSLPPTTVHTWKRNGKIPHKNWEHIIHCSQDLPIPVVEMDFLSEAVA